MSDTKRKPARLAKPCGDLVLIKKGKKKDRTAAGLILPDAAKKPTMGGMVVAISRKVEQNLIDFDFALFDRVVYDITESIPVSLDHDNEYFFVHAGRILGVLADEDDDGDL